MDLRKWPLLGRVADYFKDDTDDQTNRLRTFQLRREVEAEGEKQEAVKNGLRALGVPWKDEDLCSGITMELERQKQLIATLSGELESLNARRTRLLERNQRLEDRIKAEEQQQHEALKLELLNVTSEVLALQKESATKTPTLMRRSGTTFT